MKPTLFQGLRAALLSALLLVVPTSLAAQSIKFSALPAGSALGGTEAIPAVQSGASVRITPAQLDAYVAGVKKASNLSDLTNFVTARSNLGVAIGSNVQAYDAELAAWAGLSSAADTLGYFNGSGTATITPLTAFGRSLIDDAANTNARSTLGLVIGTDVQAYDAELASIAGLSSVADRVAYFTGTGTAALATLTSFGRSQIDDADATAGRSTLGLGTSATVNTGTSGATIPVLNAANTFSGATVVSGARLTVTGSGGWLSIGAENAVTIASDAITAVGTNMIVDTQAGAASDNLANINGSHATGDIIVIKTANDARDIVVKAGTGNIKLNGSADLTLTTVYATLTLLRLASGWWAEQGRSVP